MTASAARARAVASGTGAVSRRAGITLGIGLGGFVDGIALHQIAHWHDMGSARVPPTTMATLEANMRWDGLFDAVVWLVTLAGVFMLLADARRRTPPPPSARALTGQMLLGWGLFNLVEGTVDHHVLNLHHVRDLPTHLPAYDWIFLLVAGIGFIAAGRAIAKSG